MKRQFWLNDLIDDEKGIGWNDLPLWARSEVVRSEVGTELSSTSDDGDTLLITGGKIYFNGQRIYRPGETIESE